MFTYPFNEELDKRLDEKGRQIPKIIAVSGKGGTGKTTVTSSLACHRALLGRKVLVVSIDPAHSLGDSLDLDLGDHHVHEVPGVPNLIAWELDLQSRDRNAPGSVQQRDLDPGSIQAVMSDVFFPISEEANVIFGLISVFNYINS